MWFMKKNKMNKNRTFALDFGLLPHFIYTSLNSAASLQSISLPCEIKDTYKSITFFHLVLNLREQLAV